MSPRGSRPKIVSESGVAGDDADGTPAGGRRYTAAGTQMSGARPTMVPANPGGATPTSVTALLFTNSVCPIAALSPPSARCQ